MADVSTALTTQCCQLPTVMLTGMQEAMEMAAGRQRYENIGPCLHQ